MPTVWELGKKFHRHHNILLLLIILLLLPGLSERKLFSFNYIFDRLVALLNILSHYILFLIVHITQAKKSLFSMLLRQPFNLESSLKLAIDLEKEVLIEESEKILCQKTTQ